MSKSWLAADRVESATDLAEVMIDGSNFVRTASEVEISMGRVLKKDAMTASDISGDLRSIRSIVGRYSDVTSSIDMTVALKKSRKAI